MFTEHMKRPDPFSSQREGEVEHISKNLIETTKILPYRGGEKVREKVSERFYIVLYTFKLLV